jgi:hypothetical protein
MAHPCINLVQKELYHSCRSKVSADDLVQTLYQNRIKLSTLYRSEGVVYYMSRPSVNREHG